jgi:small subunit ribosomal protein S20
MPHTKSAAKRLRQNEKRRRRNRTWIKLVKKQTRAVMETLTADAAKAGAELVAAAKKLDKAAAKGVIHRNKAARLKSRLARKLNAAKAKKA